MSQEIITITLQLPLNAGSVNCFLVDTGAGFILVDTGVAARRAELEQRLVNAGCKPGSLRLILITHGDFDHTGNAAYLRDKFGAPVGMHAGDAGMAERGDMFWNRKSGSRAMRLISRLLVRLAEADRFAPDVLLEEGQDLSFYGWQARILSLPGHSLGSVGVLTASGELICGDLLENTKKPALNSIMDDPQTARASLERLRGMGIGTVYPGHGRPFPLEQVSG